ncbi:MAG: DUF3572 domain-containing protein [Thalassovita sp.]
MSNSKDAAETLALKALAWLVGNEELLPVFLGASGASAEGLRDSANAPEFLGAVLDFLLMDDAWVTQCCDALAVPYESLMQARGHLAGGAQMHWT